MTQLSSRFTQLSQLLQQTQAYWRPSAFHQPILPWAANHPVLVDHLLTLSPKTVEDISGSLEMLVELLTHDIPQAPELISASRLESAKIKTLPIVSPHFYAGMPGRKWQQVSAFAACLTEKSTPMVEWCAGKSYLGFYLQHLHKIKITALEWDEALVSKANKRAKQQNCDLQSHCIDVLGPHAQNYVNEAKHVVALHACGELHEQLLKLSVDCKVSQLNIAPCCYHKRQQENYLPLSHLGKQLDLKLTKSDLHAAVMETVTAGATIQRQRKQLQIMRLGFDCLQRDILGKNEFLALPSLPGKWARAEFHDFCIHCATLKKLDLPNSVNWQEYLLKGEQRFNEVSALDLVRFLFRRPLEVWLAFDRAMLLEEQGYNVSLSEFCPNHVTPRNIMIEGILPAL